MPLPDQLPLFRASGEDPRIAELMRHLDRRGWLTRRQIAQALEWDDRTIRSVVEASEGAILAGQRGYKLTRQATREEFDDSCRALRSQIEHNTIRLRNQQREFHRAPSAGLSALGSGYGSGA